MYEVLASVCISLCTTQHRAVLIIFPLILPTNNRAQMLSIAGEGAT